MLFVLAMAIVTIAGNALNPHLEPTLVFALSALSILGLAWLIGQSTERLGEITGPQVGGILNATFGNIAELIIAFFALQEGLIDVVKASLTGSIIGNLLLVLGLSVLVGGIKNGRQTFSREVAGSNAALLVLAAIGLLIPAVLAFSTPASSGSVVEDSVLVSIFLIVGYVLSLVYQFTNPATTLGGHEPRGAVDRRGWSGREATIVLVAAAVLLAVLSEILVGAIEPVVNTLGPHHVLRRGRDPARDRQPRRAARRRPARVQEQDGVLDGRVLRREPPGRAVRRAGARPRRRR